jgi:ubiquinone/menaquinone biosynthesis C-methylase UbiE
MNVNLDSAEAARELPKTRDFARIADRYDDSRELPFNLLKVLYERMEKANLLRPKAHIVDLGCGTGQLSLPLVKRGYSVTGVDFADAMLDQYRSKLRASDDVKLIRADARRLPIPSHSADAAISSKLLMHVPQWQLAVAEIVRVVKPKGYFFHIYERGAFINQVRSRFAAVCDALGYKNRHPGLQREEHLTNYLTSLGARPFALGGSALRWSKRVSYHEAISGFEDRLFGEFWELKDSVYDCILQLVKEWAANQPDGLDTVELMTPSIEIDAFELP